MIDILIKAGGFILIIMLGFALKTKGSVPVNTEVFYQQSL